MDLIRLLSSFAIGGIISVIAQLLIDLTKLTPARILVILVCTGVFLGGIGVFKPLFEFAGCGASVPLVGFGGNIAKGVKKAVDEAGIFGVLGGAFSAAAIGCTVSLVTGFLASVFFKGKSKRL